MTVFLFVFSHYTALFGLAALSYVVGRRLTRACPYRSPGEAAAMCTAAGLGAIACVIFALCLFQLLYPATVLVTLIAVAILTLPEWRLLFNDLRNLASFSYGERRLLPLLVASLIIFLPAALLPLYPPYTSDETWYHLALAKLYVQHHGFVFTPYVHLSLFPQFTEMLFTLALLLFDDVEAHLTCFLMMIVIVVGLSALAHRLFSRRVAYWAAALVLANPMILFLGSVAFIDIAVTLFATLALYACWNWVNDRYPAWLIVSAAFAGFAGGSKYSGLFFLVLIAGVVSWHSLRDRRFTPVLLFLATALLACVPWYARSWYYTGNPVFPFFPKFFGYGYYSREDVAYILHNLHEEYGFGRSLKAFILLPWHLAFNQGAFNTEAHGNHQFFLFMPLLAVFALKDARIRSLCAVAFLYIVFWFFGSQETRYLAPAFPIISLSMAAAVNLVLESRPFVFRWRQDLLAVGIVFALLAWPGPRYALRLMRELGPLPVTQAQRDEFLSSHKPSYPAYVFLNRRNGRNYTLYAFEDPYEAYFCDGTYMGDSVGPARYSRIRRYFGDSQGLYRELRALGADHLLLRGVEGPALRQDAFFHEHFTLVYARPPVVVFKLAKARD